MPITITNPDPSPSPTPIPVAAVKNMTSRLEQWADDLDTANSEVLDDPVTIRDLIQVIKKLGTITECDQA